MTIKKDATKRSVGKVSAKKSVDNVVIVKPSDIWNGAIPKQGSGYMRAKAALTAIASPLIDMARLHTENGRVIVSFPKSIILPEEFTQAEISDAINCLATF